MIQQKDIQTQTMIREGHGKQLIISIKQLYLNAPIFVMILLILTLEL